MLLKVFLVVLSKIYFFEVGQHYYWNIFGFQVHGQVLINTWLVLAIIILISIFTTRELGLVSSTDILVILVNFFSFGFNELKLDAFFFHSNSFLV
jgi:hypothetical protein